MVPTVGEPVGDAEQNDKWAEGHPGEDTTTELKEITAAETRTA
jgi:hypothetical protein